MTKESRRHAMNETKEDLMMKYCRSNCKSKEGKLVDWLKGIVEHEVQIT